jgi:hypothetical protein
MSKAHILFVLGVVAVVGCESPQDKARDADEARKAADQKVVQINRATDQKVDQVARATERTEISVERRATDDVARIARDGETKVIEAKLGADRKANDATEALLRAREQARVDASHKLDGLDSDVADLRPRLEEKLSSAAAATVEQELEAKTGVVRRNIHDLDACSADDLESVKRSTSAALDDLEQALAGAKKRL